MRKNLSIYIHIPFCVKKCVYCDFLSFGADDPQINRSGAVRKAYVQSICRELLSYKSISKDYIVRTIYRRRHSVYTFAGRDHEYSGNASKHL